MSPILTLKSVEKKFRGQWVLRDLNLTLSAGEKIGLTGPSGSGKTTVALIAAGLIRPTSGAVWLHGEDTTRWSARRWLNARRSVQLLFQDPRILLCPHQTVRQNLLASQALHNSSIDPEQLMRQLSIQGWADKRPTSLSGGELRRASLARVLMAEPDLLIADEPAVGLDMHLKADCLHQLLSALSPQSALLLISHDPAVLNACQIETTLELSL